MKFKLVDCVDSRLEEKTNPDKEVGIHVFADANTKTYNLKGLKSVIVKRYRRRLLLLCTDIMGGDISLGEQLLSDIESNRDWQVHHINGIHKDSSTSDLPNLALVKNLHKTITQHNSQAAANRAFSFPITGTPDIDKLIYRLLVVLHNNNIDAKTIFNSDMYSFDVLVNDVIPQETAKEFYNMYPVSTPDVIRLIDLKNYK